VCHSIAAKCVNLSAGFQVSLVTGEYEDKGDAPMSSSELELVASCSFLVWHPSRRVTWRLGFIENLYLSVAKISLSDISMIGEVEIHDTKLG